MCSVAMMAWRILLIRFVNPLPCAGVHLDGRGRARGAAGPQGCRCHRRHAAAAAGRRLQRGHRAGAASSVMCLLYMKPPFCICSQARVLAELHALNSLCSW